MKKFATALMLLNFALLPAAYAVPSEMTAAELHSFCNSSDSDIKRICSFYILGVVQGIGLGAGAANDKAHFCIPDDVPASHLIAIFQKTAVALNKNYPSDMGSSAASIVGAAVAHEFPCK